MSLLNPLMRLCSLQDIDNPEGEAAHQDNFEALSKLEVGSSWFVSDHTFSVPFFYVTTYCWPSFNHVIAHLFLRSRIWFLQLMCILGSTILNPRPIILRVHWSVVTSGLDFSLVVPLIIAHSFSLWLNFTLVLIISRLKSWRNLELEGRVHTLL
jgi:hypothetical protein